MLTEERLKGLNTWLEDLLTPLADEGRAPSV